MNSLINHVLGSSSINVVPEVGMSATLLFATHRCGCTVIDVSSNGKRVKVQLDHAVRTDSNGVSEIQMWQHSRNTEGTVYTFSLRKNGCWISVGTPMHSSGDLMLGHRESYYDFSF